MTKEMRPIFEKGKWNDNTDVAVLIDLQGHVFDVLFVEFPPFCRRLYFCAGCLFCTEAEVI